MSKQNGLGDNLYVGSVDLSGDIGAIDSIASPQKTIDVTGIDKSAYERIGGLRDGKMEYTAFFNKSAGQAHQTLKALPATDQLTSYFRGTAIGSPAASMLAKQLNYDGTRKETGEFTFKVSADANAYGLEWGTQLTPGKRSDVAATSGTPFDFGAVQAALAFGFQAYLHVFSFTGTSVTITIQDSLDNGADPYVDVVGGGFSVVTAAGTQRIATSNALAVKRYLRVKTAGVFTQCTFAVVVNRNQSAGVVF